MNLQENIRKILREQFEYKQQLFDLLRSGDSDNIEMVKILSQGQGIDILELLIEYFKENGPPYFKLLNHFDLSEDELINVLSKLLDYNIHKIKKYSNSNIIYSKNGNRKYYEDSNGWWVKKEYDDRGNEIYYEDSYGDWKKMEYDENRNLIYSERSDGHWFKREYDNRGNRIYYENSRGFIIDNR